MLLHGIMSSIAEFYSRNLATEVTKGLVQKAKAGGTPGKAPIGYLNVRKLENGREVRTVEIDAVRAPHVRWAFDAYASGDWRLQQLSDELNRRGLDVPPTRSKPTTKIHVSRLHALLKNPYYKGVVSYCGVEHEGSHQPLVSPATWQHVQDVLAAHNHAGEKQRRHNHYLKSSLYCGHCGSRMIVTHSRSQTGRLYAYFTCIGKHQKRTGCTMRAIPIQRIEELVEDHYASVQLPGELRARLESRLREDIVNHYEEARSQHARLQKQRAQLVNERTKLLEAHYAGAIPLDLLGTEQKRISRSLEIIAAKIAETDDHQTLIEANLRRALDLASDCHSAYRRAPPPVRRLFNQVFFNKLYIADADTITSELATPFNLLLPRAAGNSARGTLSHNTPIETIVKGAKETLRAVEALSVKQLKMVAGAGFEPATSGL